jgi:hypothetical protein
MYITVQCRLLKKKKLCFCCGGISVFWLNGLWKASYNLSRIAALPNSAVVAGDFREVLQHGYWPHGLHSASLAWCLRYLGRNNCALFATDTQMQKLADSLPAIGRNGVAKKRKSSLTRNYRLVAPIVTSSKRWMPFAYLSDWSICRKVLHEKKKFFQVSINSLEFPISPCSVVKIVYT